MLLKNKLDNFKSYIKSDNVLTTMEERYCYARDALNLEIEIKTNKKQNLKNESASLRSVTKT